MNNYSKKPGPKKTRGRPKMDYGHIYTRSFKCSWKEVDIIWNLSKQLNISAPEVIRRALAYYWMAWVQGKINQK